MRREEHNKVDSHIFGKDYDDVHKWIDSSFPKYVKINPYHHWKEHHHIEAIKEKYGWRTDRYNVAFLHIVMDYLSHFGVCDVPQNEEEVIKTLKTFGRW